MSTKLSIVFVLSISLLQIPSIARAKGLQASQKGTANQKWVVQSLFNLLDKKDGSLEEVILNWEMSLTPMLSKCTRFFATYDSRAVKLWEVPEKKTKQNLDRDFHAMMMRWLWKQDFNMHPYYTAFKAKLHAPIDDQFHWWFYLGLRHTIRLDEIIWGGVTVDGIPP